MSSGAPRSTRTARRSSRAVSIGRRVPTSASGDARSTRPGPATRVARPDPGRRAVRADVVDRVRLVARRRPPRDPVVRRDGVSHARPRTGGGGRPVRLVDDPALGPLVGLAEGRLVTYAACRGLPCPIWSVDADVGRPGAARRGRRPGHARRHRPGRPGGPRVGRSRRPTASIGLARRTRRDRPRRDPDRACDSCPMPHGPGAPRACRRTGSCSPRMAGSRPIGTGRRSPDPPPRPGRPRRPPR